MLNRKKIESEAPLEMLIEKGMSVGEIRRYFDRSYPFLRIEFFQSMAAKGSAHRNKLIDDFQLNQKSPVTISISKDRSIASLKKDFLENTNLIVAVQRKSGNVWVDISHTDAWSLGQQNSEGEQMNH